MSNKDDFIVGLDLGSSKTCALICQPDENGKLAVAGWGSAESKGWRKGVIVNLDAVVLSIKKAVEEAENKAGMRIDSAYVGVGGPHIKGVNSRGATALGPRPREVRREDIRKVLETAQGISVPADRELLHAWPQEFRLDSQGGIRDPLGMVGARLEVNVHLVTALSTAVQSVVTAVNRAGVLVPNNGAVFEAIAAAEASLTTDDRELGVALVDIGSESSELIVYQQGAIRHTASLPLGGDHFTNDIAVGLRTPIPEAEKIKRAWSERDFEKPVEGMMEIPGVGDRPARSVSYARLSEIIKPRAADLIEFVEREVERSGCEQQLGAGLVLCGGGAKLGGLALFAEQSLDFGVRVGQPASLEKMPIELFDAAFVTATGLVVFGNRQRLLRDSRQEGWTRKVWGFLTGKNQE